MLRDERRPVLDNEITIRVSPRKLLRGCVFLVLLLAVFYVGRWSVDPPSLSGLSVGLDSVAAADEKKAASEAKAAEATLEKAPAEMAEAASPEPESTDTGATGAVGAETATSETAASDTAASESASDVSVPTGPVITTYTRVALALDNVKKTWMETWGKITDIEYTIKNNEAGTVQVSYIIMNVEGYDDFQKKLVLPVSKQTLAAGVVQANSLKVPNGFAYNEITAGDLTNVKVTIIAFDSADKEVTRTTNEFNLKG